MALANWHRRHRFCANCGTATIVHEGGYMRGCPNCGASHFPRLDPVVIMLVEHDGRLLLGRRHSWPPQRYSALAGFVSPGESVEEAVVREVFEESGISAHSPRFVASQPWPFPSSLMLGFHALSDGGDPFPRDQELEDVRWFTTEEVRGALDEDAHGPLKLPPSVAIARFLIDAWLAELER
jgi:NAD+ diphosphatase